MISVFLKSILPVLLFLFLSGCQPKVYLMPAPVGLIGNGQFFLLSEENIDENLLYTLYATNRIPIKNSNDLTSYSILPSRKLELGFLAHRVGDASMNWEDLQRESLKQDRDKDLLLTQEFVRPMALFNEEVDLQQMSARAEGFFDTVNKALRKTYDKDITVYVHGANSNFHRATAQGAQFFHFTGHNSIILSFSWPSAENIFRYKTDVLHAKQTIPAFSRLLEILAIHTKARNINIIAYSAGAQVVAPGLAYLHDLYPGLSSKELKKKLRIGEVYFAAPDTTLKSFVGRYLKFSNIVNRTTITLNKNDRILFLAALQNRKSSLGRPDVDELDKSEIEQLIEVLDTVNLDVIDVGGSKALNLGRSHDYWYSNSWVSNDLLMVLIFNASPEERGLVRSRTEVGSTLYYFPDNYDAILPYLLKEQKDKMQQYSPLKRTENR